MMMLCLRMIMTVILTIMMMIMIRVVLGVWPMGRGAYEGKKKVCAP